MNKAVARTAIIFENIIIAARPGFVRVEQLTIIQHFSAPIVSNMNKAREYYGVLCVICVMQCSRYLIGVESS